MLAGLLTFGARQLTIILLVVGTVGLGLGLGRLKIDTSIDLLFNQNDPDLVRYDEVTAQFGSDTTAVIHFRDPALFTAAKLAMVEGVVRSLERNELIQSVESIFSAPNLRDQEGALVSQPVLDQAPQDDADAARARREALANPLIRGNLVSADGKAMVVIARVGRVSHITLHSQIEALLEPVRRDIEHVSQVGAMRTGVELRNGMLRDVARMAPLAVVVLTLVVHVMLRQARLAVVPLLTGLLSILWTFGLLGWLGIAVNMLTPILIALLICIGSAEDIHMIAGYLEAREEVPDRMEAMALMSRRLSTAVVVNIFTTVLGFGSNLWTDLKIISDFAISCSAGIAFNGVITVLLVPLMMRTLAPRAHHASAREQRTAERLTAGVMRWVVGPAWRFEKAVLALTALGCAVALGLTLDSGVNNDPLAHFFPESPLVRDTLAVAEDLDGVQSFYVTLRGAEPGAFLQPAHLRLLEQVRDAVTASGFDRALSIVDHLTLINKVMHDGDPAFAVLPDSADLVEQYFLFYRRSELMRYVSDDYRSANLVVRHNIFQSSVFNPRLETLRARVAAVMPPGVTVDFVGKSLLINKAADALVVNELQGLAMAIGCIVVVLSLMFRSIHVGVLAMLPNVLPIIAVYGTARLIGLELNPATVMVAAVAIGIAVDDTTHLLVRYGQLCREDPHSDTVVREVIQAEAVPVLTSTLALIGGFAVSMSSGFASTAQFGFMAALTIFYGLMTEMILSPLMLRRIDARRRRLTIGQALKEVA